MQPPAGSIRLVARSVGSVRLPARDLVGPAATMQPPAGSIRLVTGGARSPASLGTAVAAASRSVLRVAAGAACRVRSVLSNLQFLTVEIVLKM